MDYYITKHAVDRLKERFPSIIKKFTELKTWTIQDGTSVIKPFFDELIKESKEDKSHLNNTMYMLKLQDKYGIDTQYKFLINEKENLLLTFKKDISQTTYALITIMPTDFKPTSKNIKYNNTSTKKEKRESELLSLYDKYANQNLPKLNISQKLLQAITNQKTTPLGKISKTKTLHEFDLEGNKYQFIYSKSTLTIEIISKEEATEIVEKVKEKKLQTL